MPFKGEEFDATFSILVWHLLEFPEKAAQELKRVLKQDGKFLIITANPNARESWESFFTNVKNTGKKLEATLSLPNSPDSHDTLYFHSENEMKELLISSGLFIERIEYFRQSEKFPEQFTLISIEGKKL